jgi:hypothetical protein
MLEPCESHFPTIWAAITPGAGPRRRAAAPLRPTREVAKLVVYCSYLERTLSAHHRRRLAM